MLCLLASNPHKNEDGYSLYSSVTLEQNPLVNSSHWNYKHKLTSLWGTTPVHPRINNPRLEYMNVGTGIDFLFFIISEQGDSCWTLRKRLVAGMVAGLCLQFDMVLTRVFTLMDENIWWLPNIGLPPVLIHFRFGFSMK